MRPGPRLPRLIVITAALAALIPVALWVEWVVVGAFALVVVAAGTAAAALRSIAVAAERPAKIALALDEVETTAVDLSSNAARPLRLIVRQRWPELVAQRSIVASALRRERPRHRPRQRRRRARGRGHDLLRHRRAHRARRRRGGARRPAEPPRR